MDSRVLKTRDTATQPPRREIVSRTNQRIARILNEVVDSNLKDSILKAFQTAYVEKDADFMYRMTPERQCTLKIYGANAKYYNEIMNPLCRRIKKQQPKFYISDNDIRKFFKDKVEWVVTNRL